MAVVGLGIRVDMLSSRLGVRRRLRPRVELLHLELRVKNGIRKTHALYSILKSQQTRLRDEESEKKSQRATVSESVSSN